QLVFLRRLVVRHHDDAAVAARVADVGEADARVAGRAFDDGAARLELAAFLGRLDDAARGAILDRAARIHELGLAEDLAAGLITQRAEADERGVADGAGEARRQTRRGGRSHDALTFASRRNIVRWCTGAIIPTPSTPRPRASRPRARGRAIRRPPAHLQAARAKQPCCGPSPAK